MKILIAEDDRVSRRLLEAKLVNWGYEVIVTCDGDEAWEAIRADDAPRLAIIDWMMPGVDGLEICRRMRKEAREPYTYIILLTALHRDEDLVAGMDTPEGMIHVTSSLGVATYEKGGKHDVNALVKSADRALYAAKEKGRNRVEIALD